MTKEASQKRHVHDECGSSIVAEKRAEGEQNRVLSIRRPEGVSPKKAAPCANSRATNGPRFALYTRWLRLSVQISKSFEFPLRLHKATDHTSFQLISFPL